MVDFMKKLSLVRQQKMFMQAGKQSVHEHPVARWDAGCELYWGLCQEEFALELGDAVEAYKKAPSLENLEEVADGIVDSIYVLLGLSNSLGLPFEKLWDEVQRSNMAKINPATGFVEKREDGKTLKPAGWTPPNLFNILHQAITERDNSALQSINLNDPSFGSEEHQKNVALWRERYGEEAWQERILNPIGSDAKWVERQEELLHDREQAAKTAEPGA